MSARLVDAASRLLATHASRRGFLRRFALVGSALITAPTAYALRPMTAYQAIVLPSNCRAGRCAEGWTEFCCTMTGVNTCPPGSVVAGWWRAEGSGYCGGGSRYYMDCNSSDCHGCGCGATGTCGPDCADCDCHCAYDRCDLWKSCCTRFRYGQCNQQIRCVGPIVCRVVTCVPPWEWDSTCTTVDAREDATAPHDSPCLNPPLGPFLARPGVVTGSEWALRESLSAGDPDYRFTLGVVGDVPVMGDWTASGAATAGVVRGVRHGQAGKETLTWYLRQEEGPGQPDLVVDYGQPGDLPVVGDWTGSGVDTIGVVRGNQWLLKTRNVPGPPDLSFIFGQPGDLPVAGDWDGDGRDGPGMVRGATWSLRNLPSQGPADHVFDFGEPDGIPVTGDWNGNGVTSPGRVRNGVWFLTDRLSGGPAERTFSYGDPTGIPVVWRRMPNPGGS